MDKETALKMIDEHKNSMINPVDMLNWSWLRVIILKIPDEEWERYSEMAAEVLSG